MITRVGRLAIATVATVTLSACATYQPPPLSGLHPAHPDAPVARGQSMSQTLAYTPSDAAAITVVPPRASAVDGRTSHAGPTKTVVGEGEVVAATPSSGQIVVDHGEIKGFMEAMTMGYRTEPPSLLSVVKPGDRIRFTIDVDRRAIVQIEQLK